MLTMYISNTQQKKPATRSLFLALALTIGPLPPRPATCQIAAVQLLNAAFDKNLASEMAELTVERTDLLRLYRTTLAEIQKKVKHPQLSATIALEIQRSSGDELQRKAPGLPAEALPARTIVEKEWGKLDSRYRVRISTLRDLQLRLLTSKEEFAITNNDAAQQALFTSAQKAILLAIPDFVDIQMPGGVPHRLYCGFGKVTDGDVSFSQLGAKNEWSQSSTFQVPVAAKPSFAKIKTSSGNSVLEVDCRSVSGVHVYWRPPSLPLEKGVNYKSVRWGAKYNVTQREDIEKLKKALKDPPRAPGYQFATLSLSCYRLDRDDPNLNRAANIDPLREQSHKTREIISNWEPIGPSQLLTTLDICVSGWGHVIEIDDVFIEFK